MNEPPQPDSGDILEKLVQSDATLTNAFRLMSDADLLYQHGRYSSVVGLAVLSAEEIGKYLLSRWSADDPAFQFDKHKYHREKQSAIAALFIIDGIRKEYRTRKIDFANLSPPAVAELARAIDAGFEKEGKWVGIARSKVLETVKWSGLYYDDQLAEIGIEPSKITSENAAELMRLCTRAISLLADGGNIALAKHIFCVISKPKAT